ncbi:MAG: hypothetical protein ACKVX9_11340 [Blastocatellia bacterium]
MLLTVSLLTTGVGQTRTAGSVKVVKGGDGGWTEAVVLRSGQVEAVVVPSVGRVMQFRFRGEKSGPFWENEELTGRRADPEAKSWMNFGGDKTWPAPQADWPKVALRAWPPPGAFDSMPVEVVMQGDWVEMISPVDPRYGIRTRRQVRLDPRRPVMTIRTIYEKVEGEPRRVSVWVITQLKDPDAVFAPLPDRSIFADGYVRQSKELPANLKRAELGLQMTRDPKVSTKIGTDAGRLLWIGKRESLLVDSPREARGEYPDQGSSAEIYTNPDPAAYVELEMLGPLHEMKRGDRIERENRYTLFRRKGKTVEAEARRILCSSDEPRGARGKTVVASPCSP